MRDVTRSSSTLVVPSASIASGLASYIAGIARLELDAELAFVAGPGSDLERLLPPDKVISAGNSERELIEVLKRHSRDFGRIETHGPRALLAARRSGVRSRALRHVFHEVPALRTRLGLGEIALSTGVARVANSLHVATAVKRYSRTRPEVVPPVVYPPRSLLGREAARDRLGLKDEFAIGIVGRLHPSKRPELAIAAIARLPDELRLNAVVVLIGDGPLRDRMIATAMAARVEIRALGHVPDAGAYMCAFDVYVSPSPQETFGLATAEAICALVPVAAVHAPGPSALLGDAVLADATPDALANAIVAAIAFPARRLQEIAERVHSRFGPSALRPLYERHYR